MSDNRQVLKNSKIMAAMTMISRVFGLIRDQLIAYLLGTTRIGDVWSLAFMLPNLFRRLIAEGAMSTAFVPILSELSETESRESATHFIRAVFSLILIASTVIVSLAILLLPFIMRDLLPIWKPARADDFAAVVLPTQIMFPYLLFISLAAVCQGVLNVRNRFALPAATPIILNLFIISCGYLLRDWRGNPTWGLCTGVLIGGFFQFFLQWLQLYRMGVRIRPVLQFWNERTREAVRLWLPTTFSAGVIQINALVSSTYAMTLVVGGTIALSMSTRLTELILGVFTAALSTSMLPVLAKQRTNQDREGLNRNLWTGLELMSLITIPAALGLLLAGPGVIELLYLRGQFDQDSVALTYSALIFHGIGLIPIAWFRILSQVFYAFKQVRVMVIIAAIGAAVNIAGCFTLPLLFDPVFKHAGVALATCVSSWLLFAIAVQQAEQRFQLRWPRYFTWELAKIAAACAAMIPIWLPLKAGNVAIFGLFLRIGGSIFIYAAVVHLLKVRSWRRLVLKK